MENRQTNHPDVPMDEIIDEEPELLNYHLVFPDRNGLSFDALFNLAFVVDRITVDPPMGDTRTQSQDDLHEVIMGNRPLVVISDVFNQPQSPQLLHFITYPFDTIPEETQQVTQNIVPPFDSTRILVPVDSWNDFVSDVLEEDEDSEEESGYGSEDAEMDEEDADGYTADTESLERIERLSEDGTMDGHGIGRSRRMMAGGNGADNSVPRTLSGVRGLLACELLGPIRRPPVRLRSAPCRLESSSKINLNSATVRDNSGAPSSLPVEQHFVPYQEPENVATTSNDGAVSSSTSRARSNSSNSALHTKEVRPTISSSYGGDTRRQEVQVTQRPGSGASDSDSEN